MVNAANGPDRYDAVIVGASLAGCAAATLLGRAGLRVALVERRPDPAAYKVACTHFIQASATETIQRLGLDRDMEEAGGLRNSFELWTRWGWVRPPSRVHGPGPAHGYSIRRQTLDPLVRRRALATPGVTALLGHAVTAVQERTDDVEVGLSTPAGDGHRLSAPLLVGADGRDSSVAQLAGLPVQRRPNNRFAYWAYYRGLTLPSRTCGRFWHLDPDVGYVLPMDDDVTLIVAMPSIDQLPAFKADRDAAFAAFVARLEDAPSLAEGERISPLLGKLELPNLRRPPARGRIALAGDAALACDPLPGVGCGWALQSAEWLADAVVPALADGANPARALRAYAKRHRAETGGHFMLISAMSRARQPRAHERALVMAATRDDELAARVIAFWQRRISARAYLTPSTLARTALVLGRSALTAR